jgi:hypothetical protein
MMSERRTYRDPNPCGRHQIAGCLACDVRVPEERRSGERRVRDGGTWLDRNGRFDLRNRGEVPDRRASSPVPAGGASAVRGEGVGAEGSLVGRLAARWADESPDYPEVPLSPPEAVARWFLLAIADELGQKSDVMYATEVYKWLMKEATQ